MNRQINTVSDILEVLRENPEALTELRSVMFQGDSDVTEEKVGEILQLVRRQEEAGVRREEAGVRREEAEARREEAEARREEAEIRRDAAIAKMGDAISALIESVEGLRGEVVGLRGEVEGVRGDMVGLGTELGQLKGLCVEASYTIEPKDITRVIDTRTALVKLFPEADVTGAVFGVVISDDDKRLTRRNQVRVYETQLPT